MKAYTITIESGSKVGKAVIMAESHREAMAQARMARHEGIKVKQVQDNRREQHSGARGPRGVSCAHGGVADAGRPSKLRKTPAFWYGNRH